MSDVQTPILAPARRRAVPVPDPVPDISLDAPGLREYATERVQQCNSEGEFKKLIDGLKYPNVAALCAEIWEAGRPAREAKAEAERIAREAQAAQWEADRIAREAQAKADRIAAFTAQHEAAKETRRNWMRPAGEIAMPAVEPYIDGLIDRHEAGFLAGYTGTYKTQDALELSICTILGKPFRGRSVHHTGPVMYLALEDAAALRHKRLPAMMDTMGLTPEERAKVLLTGFFMPPYYETLKLPDAMDRIEDGLLSIEEQTGEDCALLVVDTVREGLSGSVSQEGDAGPFLDAALSLAKFGPVVLLIAHVSREDRRKPLAEQQPKGIGDFLDRASFVLMKGQAGDTSELHVLKSKNHARGYSIHHKLIAGPSGTIPMQHVTDGPAKVIAARKSRRGRATP